jgi:hypothetical protein
LLSDRNVSFPLKTKRLARALGEIRLGHRLASGTEGETEIASELHIENREFRWTRQCSSSQQALACFQAKKKERAINFLRVAKLRNPQPRRNSIGGRRK